LQSSGSGLRNTSPTPIRLLHLSDIHFRADRRWDADPILRHLAERIGRDVAAGLAPDLVVITGDLAFSGNIDDYAVAADWLGEQLWPRLAAGQAGRLDRDRLLLVPGNHDVDRPAVKRGAGHTDRSAAKRVSSSHRRGARR
jgi:3',5'-cyclic AMP phosphodiesterase CpdA